MSVALTWDCAAAYQDYRATVQRVAVWYDATDCFDRPSLHRADIQRADRAIQAAWAAEDAAALARALAAWEAAMTRGRP